MIERDYYRNVDRDELLDKSLGAAVDSLDDRFSNYFSPKDYCELPGGHRRASSRASA